MVNIPFLGALAGCSARRSERRVASHTSEEQRRNAPGSAAKNGILAFSSSLSVHCRALESKTRQVGMRDLPAAHQHFSVFGAAVQRRYHLARIQQALGVKSAFDTEHLLIFFG